KPAKNRLAFFFLFVTIRGSFGVRPIRLHDARHSCGTALHLRGVPLAVIAKWLGHVDASITARMYTHSQDDAPKAAGQSLGAVVTSS
ncbi:MAG: tyrosine-type recombinase/integrase, partial [Mycobacterium sp.]|nr:tyrosine-type recombinase/integrase [Mycobacterium sp.]